MEWRKWDETWNNEVSNVTTSSLSLNNKVKNIFFVSEITQLVQLTGTQETIQHSSEYLFGLLIIRLDFVLTDGATIFKGMSVLCGLTVFHDVVSLGSMKFS